MQLILVSLMHSVLARTLTFRNDLPTFHACLSDTFSLSMHGNVSATLHSTATQPTPPPPPVLPRLVLPCFLPPCR